MIQSIMLIALGFLIATLFTLAFSSALWKRATRLTTERIKSSMPISFEEMQADKDALRAEFAIKIRQYEVKLENANLKAARQLIDLSRRETELTKAKAEKNKTQTQLEEERNANQVLKQTISTRIPQMEAQLLKAKEILGVRYQEINKLRSKINEKEGELGEIRSVKKQHQAEIQRLKSTIESQDPILSPSSEDEQFRTKNTLLEEEISNLKQQLKNAKYGAENQAENVRSEIQYLADKIIELSALSKKEPNSKTVKLLRGDNEDNGKENINISSSEKMTTPTSESLSDPIVLAQQLGIMESTNSN
ncbi:MAG: hypothetical protein AAF228_06450 [Pseudomonadota bacterium]